MPISLADASSIAQIVGTLVTIAVAVFGLSEWKKQRLILREKNALAMYARLMELTLRDPRLVHGDWVMRNFQRDDPLVGKYLVYLSLLNATTEQLFQTVGDDPAWRGTIQNLLLTHAMQLREMVETRRVAHNLDPAYLVFLRERVFQQNAGQARA